MICSRIKKEAEIKKISQLEIPWGNREVNVIRESAACVGYSENEAVATIPYT